MGLSPIAGQLPTMVECMDVCVYVCMCVCMYGCMDVCMYNIITIYYTIITIYLYKREKLEYICKMSKKIRY